MEELKKYVCSVCGFVYDEQIGLAENNIPPKTKWKKVPSDFLCPLCKAPKDAFEEQGAKKESQTSSSNEDFEKKSKEEFSFGELSVICSNYAQGSEKQYLQENAQLFSDLAAYFEEKDKEQKGDINDLEKLIKQDIESFSSANEQAEKDKDRGALRALAWSEKVTKMLNSLIKQAQKDKTFPKDNLFVCEICGFVYNGSQPPDICPVCKVPKLKIKKV